MTVASGLKRFTFPTPKIFKANKKAALALAGYEFGIQNSLNFNAVLSSITSTSFMISLWQSVSPSNTIFRMDFYLLLVSLSSKQVYIHTSCKPAEIQHIPIPPSIFIMREA
jgi:hypothetical protein